MRQKLCEPIPGRVAGMKVLNEAEIAARGYPKRPGVLGYVDGIFSVCDRENKNKRVYEHALWEEVHSSDRFRGMLTDLTLLGEPDHPETRTQSKITEGSHTIIEQHIDGDYVRGTVMVFDNPKARCFWPMLQAGVKLGFSTRGDGDLVEDAKTGRTKVDPKSYEYHGVDFVLNPSFVEAKPEAITEEACGQMRTALREAVEGKQVTEETERNVQAILEAVGPRDAKARLVEDGASRPSGQAHTKALEALVTQLAEAKNRAEELQETLDKRVVLEQDTRKEHEQEIGRLTAANKAKDDTLVQVEARGRQLGEQLAKARGDLRRLIEDTKGKVDAAQVAELKRLLQENQDSHLSLVEAHRGLIGTHRQLQAKYDEGLKVLGELRQRLAEAEKQAGAATRRADEADAASTAAREDLEANKASVPSLISESTLKHYKKIRAENVDVPDELKRLLESAGSEAEVDALLEAITARQASRYSFLPLGPNSRGLREAIAEEISDERHDGDDAKREEDNAEAAQVREVTERQLGGRRRR